MGPVGISQVGGANFPWDLPEFKQGIGARFGFSILVSIFPRWDVVCLLRWERLPVRARAHGTSGGANLPPRRTGTCPIWQVVRVKIAIAGPNCAQSGKSQGARPEGSRFGRRTRACRADVPTRGSEVTPFLRAYATSFSLYIMT